MVGLRIGLGIGLASGFFRQFTDRRKIHYARDRVRVTIRVRVSGRVTDRFRVGVMVRVRRPDSSGNLLIRRKIHYAQKYFASQR